MSGKKWTIQEEKLLTEKYPDFSTKDLVKLLKRSYSSICQHAIKIGLSKSEAFLNSDKSGRIFNGICSNGTRSDFPLNAQPFNKGKKQSEWMSKEGLKKVRKTQFKKGQRPKSAHPIGTVVIRTEAGKKYYYQNSRPLQVINWEKVHGKIPKGFFIRCKTYDTLNTESSNW